MFLRIISTCMLVWLTHMQMLPSSVHCQDVPVGCGGFVKSSFKVDFTRIHAKMFSKSGVLKYTTDCAPNNGYFLIPLYDRGEFVIKIDSPTGWLIEPSEFSLFVDGETDRCSMAEDINFELLGFSVNGQVVSAGLNIGPSGVTMKLIKDKEEIQKTITTEDGRYAFEGIVPGTYQLLASHSVWKVSKEPVEVIVSGDSVDVSLDSGPVVMGYDVKGEVFSGGEPVEGVQILLHAEPGVQVDCVKTETSTSSNSASSQPTCVMTSDKSGRFVFESLPPGTFTLVPVYRREMLDFEVQPTELKINVLNDTVVVKPSFEVQGFSVSGKTLLTRKTGVVGGAKVYVNGELFTRTDNNGKYRLHNVTTGTYKIQIEAPNLSFAPLEIYVSPSNPSIPDIIPAKYSVCGSVALTTPPSKAVTAGFREVQVFTGGPSASLVTSVSTDENGNYCVLLPLGEYRVKVIVTKEEAQDGLVILPSEQLVAMPERPITTKISFYQFLATLTGTVRCIEKCPEMEVTLKRIQKKGNGQSLTAKVTSKEKKGQFTFENVLPGTVTVSVAHAMWCWSSQDLTVEIVKGSQRPLEFNQTGYSMSYSVSHDTPVSYSVGDNEETDTVLIGQGQLCLTEPGVYTVTPKSCYKFEKNSYKFDTTSAKPLVMQSIGHTLSAGVLAQKEDKSLALKIRSVRFAAGDQDLRPSGVTQPRSKDGSQDNASNTWTYSFSFISKPADELEVVPTSSKLMFTPPSQRITVSEDCPQEIPPFEGSEGLMINGHTEPPLEGIEISIGQYNEAIFSTTTDSSGQYRAGPFHSGEQFSVVATLEGYAFEPLQDDPHSFKAMKLSRIIIQAADTDSTPLSNVFVSLSGANFRSNNFTSDSGRLEYKKLTPGQFFIKPLLREYEFAPSSKVVDVVQGQSEEISFIGTRVAFGCSGKVTTLNRQPLEGATVEVSINSDNPDCSTSSEETNTDNEGIYRIRGLAPGCSYTLAVKCDDEVGNIARSLPTNRTIELINKDIENLDFIALLKPTTIQVTGNVITQETFLGTLKAQIFIEGKSTPLHSASVNVAGFFFFPSIPVSKTQYVVTLEASLSSHYYKFSRAERTVPGDRNEHVTLHFSAEEQKIEKNGRKGSVLALIITVAVIFVLANAEKVILWVQDRLSSNSHDSSMSSNPAETRRKSGRRR